MSSNNSRTQSMVWAAMGANALIMVTKFAVAIISGSVAMMAEAVHSVADTFNQIFLMISIKTGSKPADEKHPFGYGKERFFWAFLTAIMIFFVGAFFSIYEGIKKLTEHSTHFDERTYILSLVTLGAAFVFESISAAVGIFEISRASKLAKKKFAEYLAETKDLTLKTVIFEDSAAIIGLIIAAVGLYFAYVTGSTFYDGLASILIGIVLAFVAFYLAKESRSLLLGQTASAEDVANIRKVISNEPEVENIVDLLTMHMGPEEILVTAHVQISDKLLAKQQEALIDKIEKNIINICPKVRKIFIEPEMAAHRTKDPLHN